MLQPLNKIDSFRKITVVITSVNFRCFSTVIVYTRSMFISLRLRSELVFGYIFPETVHFKIRKKNKSFLQKKYETIKLDNLF